MKWACILGVSSGFGEAIALDLAKKGYGIFGVHLDRRNRAEAIAKQIETLKGCGVPVVFFNGNAASEDQRTEAIESFLNEKSEDDTIQVFVHSLAFGSLRPYFPKLVEDQGRALNKRQMDMTLDIMAHSLVYWVQDLVERSLFAKGARIYGMTSSGSIAVWPSYGAVSAAKCALESHIRQLALELAPLGITANAIMAGVTRTPALEKIPGGEELALQAEKRNPSGRLTSPEDIGRFISAICGPETQWMTGNVLRVDGGETITS